MFEENFFLFCFVYFFLETNSFYCETSKKEKYNKVDKKSTEEGASEDS